ncbi:MAG: hypothetical protein ACOX47_10955 [Bacillota bacterium]
MLTKEERWNYERRVYETWKAAAHSDLGDINIPRLWTYCICRKQSREY